MTDDPSHTPTSVDSPGASPPGRPPLKKGWIGAAVGVVGAAAIWGGMALFNDDEGPETQGTAPVANETTTAPPEFGMPYSADDPAGDVTMCADDGSAIAAPGTDIATIEVLQRVDSGAAVNERWVRINTLGPLDETAFSFEVHVTVTDPAAIDDTDPGFEPVASDVVMVFGPGSQGPPIAVVTRPEGQLEVPAIVTENSVMIPLPPLPDPANMFALLKTTPTEDAEPICDTWLGRFAPAETPMLAPGHLDGIDDLGLYSPKGDQTVCGDPTQSGEGPGDIAGVGVVEMNDTPYLSVSLPGTPILMDSPYDFTVTIDVGLPSGTWSYVVSRVGNGIDFHSMDQSGNTTPLTPNFAEGTVSVPLPETPAPQFEVSVTTEVGMPGSPALCDSLTGTVDTAGTAD